jgi:hypothetical protein
MYFVKSAGRLVSHFVILEAYNCVPKYFRKIAAMENLNNIQYAACIA